MNLTKFTNKIIFNICRYILKRHWRNMSTVRLTEEQCVQVLDGWGWVGEGWQIAISLAPILNLQVNHLQNVSTEVKLKNCTNLI